MHLLWSVTGVARGGRGGGRSLSHWCCAPSFRIRLILQSQLHIYANPDLYNMYLMYAW